MENTLTEIIDKEVFFYLLNSSFENEEINNKIQAIFFLGFDDNIGQLIEKYYSSFSIDSKLLEEVSFIGFPETTASDEDQTYYFSFRKNTSALLSNICIQDQQFYFCYAFVIRVKCDTLKRGYIQKSIVILSEQYNPKYYQLILNEIVSLYIKNNYVALKEEELLNYLFKNKIEIQEKKKPIIHRNSFQPQNYIMNSFLETFSLFYLIKISSIWEMVITETPILVVGEEASNVSNVVMLLQSIIYPLKYRGDIRPYFSIYDIDFKQYRDNNNLLKNNSPILGIINPLLAKYFQELENFHFDDLFYNEKNKENPTKNIIFKSFEKIEKKEKKYFYFHKKYSTLIPDKHLIKSLYDFFEENKNEKDNNSIKRLDNYLRMYLLELNNNFMKTFDTFFFKFHIDEIKKIAFLKKNFSMYEIFDEKKFLNFLLNVPNNFNDKYVKNTEKTSELYFKFIKTKIFKSYLKNVHLRIKSMN